MSGSISSKIAEMHVIDTHEHTYPHEVITNRDLSIVDILEGSYVFWATSIPRKDDLETLVRNLKMIAGSAFYKACSLAIREIYGVDIDPPTKESLAKASEVVKDVYCDKDWLKKVFREKALIEKALLDPYWDIWGGSFDKDLFSPVFRINTFLFGYSRDARDHNGNCPYNFERYLNIKVDSFEDYIDLVDRALEEAKRRKYVAIKSALAYDRPILFEEVDEAEAKKVYEKGGANLTPRDIKIFGDFILDRIIRRAEKLDMPIQFHTGLALIEGSNPMNLVRLLRKYTNVKFIFFHGGYPWIRESAALAFSFPNLYIDLCWLPIISPSACKIMLREIIELGLSNRTMWGGDCWVAEATYGALRLFKDLLSEVLQEMVDKSYLRTEEALSIASEILRENAARIFNFH